MGEEEVVVTVGGGEGLATVDVMVDVSSDGSLSLQPNQPGVLHVDVDEVEVEVVLTVVVALLVVDSSRQPHQPGVLQVSVRVRVLRVRVVVDVGIDFDEVVVSVPLLSKYSHG